MYKTVYLFKCCSNSQNKSFMAISSRPWTGRTVSLIDVSISGPPNTKLAPLFLTRLKTHTCTCTKRHGHCFAPFLFSSSSKGWTTTRPGYISSVVPSPFVFAILPLCILQGDWWTIEWKQEQGKPWRHVTDRVTWLLHKPATEIKIFPMIASRTHPCARGGCRPRNPQRLSKPILSQCFFPLFIFPAQKRAFLPCGEKRRAPALEPGLILSLLISIVARRRLTACAAGETSTHVSLA